MNRISGGRGGGPRVGVTRLGALRPANRHLARSENAPPLAHRGRLDFSDRPPHAGFLLEYLVCSSTPRRCSLCRACVQAETQAREQRLGLGGVLPIHGTGHTLSSATVSAVKSGNRLNGRLVARATFNPDGGGKNCAKQP